MYKIGLVIYILDSFTFRSRTFHIFSLCRLRSPSTIVWSKYGVSGSRLYQILDQNKKRVEIGKRHYRSSEDRSHGPDKSERTHARTHAHTHAHTPK